MSDQEYLEAILADQTLEEGGEELKALRAHRKDVEDLLRAKFGLGGPSIRYGGSYKKGTMNRDSYDLDMTCYFGREDTVAGTTLKEIYENVEEALREKYWTERKGSAIRLRSLDDLRSDFHIDRPRAGQRGGSRYQAHEALVRPPLRRSEDLRP